MTVVAVLLIRTGNRSAPAPAPTPSTRPAAVGRAGDPVPSGFKPTSVTWISAARGWVLGSTPCAVPPCIVLLRTVDGGRSWARVPAPPTDPGVGVRRVRFADERNGWIYGPELWATHDGGSTWRRLEPAQGRAGSVEAAGGTVYAVMGVAGARVFATDVGTDDWRPAGDDPVDADATLTAGGERAYVVGVDRAVRALSGGRLERRGTPCPEAAASLAVAGATVVGVCVSGAVVGSSTKALVVSSDRGWTWTPAGTPPRPGSVAGVAAASPSTVVVAAASGGSWLYRSDDGGGSWTTVYTELTGGTPFEDLGFIAGPDGSVVIGGRLLATTDAGVTWSPVAFEP